MWGISGWRLVMAGKGGGGGTQGEAPLDRYGNAGADRIFCRGGSTSRVLRAPLASTPTGGLGLINIRLRYIASIEYSERFFLIFFFWLVKKFVEKQNWWSRAGGVTTPKTPPLDPRLQRNGFVHESHCPKNATPIALAISSKYFNARWGFTCLLHIS